MTTATADMNAVETGADNDPAVGHPPVAAQTNQQYVLPPRLMARLEAMACKRGWTPGQALVRALNVAEILFNATDDPKTKVYIHQRGERYSLDIPR